MAWLTFSDDDDNDNDEWERKKSGFENSLG